MKTETGNTVYYAMRRLLIILLIPLLWLVAPNDASAQYYRSYDAREFAGSHIRDLFEAGLSGAGYLYLGIRHPVDYYIDVRLPPDRSKVGELRFYSGRGFLLFGPVPVFGKADNKLARKKGNASRSPIEQYGDTPAGDYDTFYVSSSKISPSHKVPYNEVTNSDGLYSFGVEGLLALIPKSGQALVAKNQGNRSGLFIHPGEISSAGDLRATAGCLRIHPNTMANIVNYLQAIYMAEMPNNPNGKLKGSVRIWPDMIEDNEYWSADDVRVSSSADDVFYEDKDADFKSDALENWQLLNIDDYLNTEVRSDVALSVLEEAINLDFIHFHSDQARLDALLSTVRSGDVNSDYEDLGGSDYGYDRGGGSSSDNMNGGGNQMGSSARYGGNQIGSSAGYGGTTVRYEGRPINVQGFWGKP